MRNRSTDLIEWNDALSSGMGRSRTRYALSYDRSQGLWLVAVDGHILCTSSSIQDTLARSEGLEALRCILQGQSCELSDEHCRMADLTASEMLKAASGALASSPCPEEEEVLLESLDALQALSGAIRGELANRQRESAATPSRH